MKHLKKILAAALAAAMAFVMLAVPAGAESIADTAKAIKSGKQYSHVFAGKYAETAADYKIVSKSNGSLNINISANCEYAGFSLYDSDFNKVACTSTGVKTGSIYTGGAGYEFTAFEWNRTGEKISANINYDIKKGTYYLRVFNRYYGDDGSGVTFSGTIKLSATFPSSDSSSTSSSPYLTLEVKKGSSVQLGTTISGATWSTSKKSVATVSSSGKVTAKKKGSAIITAKVNGTTIKVKIKVK